MEKVISELPLASFSKRVLVRVHNHSYENEFNLQVNEISFSYERMGTKTRFEKEAKGKLELRNNCLTWIHLSFQNMYLTEDRSVESLLVLGILMLVLLLKRSQHLMKSCMKASETPTSHVEIRT